jgi:hypothetical protein
LHRALLRGFHAVPLALLYCEPIVNVFVGSSTINFSPFALGWLLVVMNWVRLSNYGGIARAGPQTPIAFS